MIHLNSMLNFCFYTWFIISILIKIIVKASYIVLHIVEIAFKKVILIAEEKILFLKKLWNCVQHIYCLRYNEQNMDSSIKIFSVQLYFRTISQITLITF